MATFVNGTRWAWRRSPMVARDEPLMLSVRGTAGWLIGTVPCSRWMSGRNVSQGAAGVGTTDSAISVTLSRRLWISMSIDPFRPMLRSVVSGEKIGPEEGLADGARLSELVALPPLVASEVGVLAPEASEEGVISPVAYEVLAPVASDMGVLDPPEPAWTTIGRMTWYCAPPCGALVSRSVTMARIVPAGWSFGTVPTIAPALVSSDIHADTGSVWRSTGLSVLPRRGAGKLKDWPGETKTGGKVTGPLVPVGDGAELPGVEGARTLEMMTGMVTEYFEPSESGLETSTVNEIGPSGWSAGTVPLTTCVA